jgi:2-dehydropantoate 2-reductase
VRILVLGAGVIGSVYAGKLLQAGHDVVLVARDRRLADLQAQGLVLDDASSGRRAILPVPAVAAADTVEHYDLVLVPVRRDQLDGTLPLLTGMTSRPDVLFFGNAAGRSAELTAALGERTLFGFPAAGGVRDGAVIRYVLIRQQKTMLADPRGMTSPRMAQLQTVFRGAGFPTRVSADVEGWLVAHAAFVVPIAFSLYRVGVDPPRLAADPAGLRRMVDATRQAFRALRATGNREIPANLRMLYLYLPQVFAVRYWRRVLASPRGELWFGAHSRAAPEEMASLAAALQAAVHRTGRAAPDLDTLLASHTS